MSAPSLQSRKLQNTAPREADSGGIFKSIGRALRQAMNPEENVASFQASKAPNKFAAGNTYMTGTPGHEASRNQLSRLTKGGSSKLGMMDNAMVNYLDHMVKNGDKA